MVRRSSAFLILLVACGPVKGNPPATDAPTDGAEPGFQLAVLTVNAAAPLDGDATVSLAVTRVGGFDGEIAIAAITPPTGLEIDPLIIPAGESTGDLIIGAVSPLVIGDEVTFTIEATSDGVESKQVEIEDAEVTGRPGSLDDSFGVGTGYAAISFGSDDAGSFNALDVLGGNIIVTGTGFAGLGPARFSTMRFTAAGGVDATFNGGTLVRTVFNPGSTNESTFSAAIGHQIDGRVILIGHHQGETPTVDLAAARLSTTGGSGGFEFGNQPDAGKALHDLGGALLADNVVDGIVLGDDRIVMIGDSGGHHMISLLSLGGALDLSFNTTGFVRDILGTASTARAVTADNDGNIMVVGQTNGTLDADLTIHRYTTAGLDTTFGTAGRVVITASGTAEAATGVAVLSNGKIIVGNTSDSNFEARRFNADGSPDTTFGTNGVAVSPSNGAVARKMILLADGKILLLAQSGNNAVLTRFKADGSIDPLFGTAGVVNVAFGDSAEVNAIIVYDSHKVVIAGGNVGGVPGPGTKGLLARVWM